MNIVSRFTHTETCIFVFKITFVFVNMAIIFMYTRFVIIL